MKIVVCYKLVPDEQDIVVNNDRSLSFDRVQWQIGQYDINGIEAGVSLAEQLDGHVVALSVGGSKLENLKLRKGVLSRGPAELFNVVDDRLENLDAYSTAKVLAEAIKKIGDVDLVVCGEGSGDLYAQQVGIQLGELLGVSTWNSIHGMEFSENNLVIERALEDEVETLEVGLPAVISVTSDLNVPRIPSMREILAAGKKPVVQWSLDDLQTNTRNSIEVVATFAPEQTDRKQIVIEGQGEEEINQLYDYLIKEIS